MKGKTLQSKKSLLIISLCILVVAGLVVWLVHYRTSSFYEAKIQAAETNFQQKLAAKEAQIQSITTILDTAYLKETFKQIDSNLYAIDRSLAARGMRGLIVKNIGGGRGLEMADIEEFVNYYKSYTKHIEDKLSFFPLGLPSDGERTSGFGYRRDPLMPDSLQSHFGLDFAGNIGDSIKTTADGVVRLAGFNGGYGNCVIITHSNGYETLYGHMSKILVQNGSRVKAGDKIGLVGSTGRSTGPHVHYEVLFNGTRLNPAKYLKL